MDAGGARHGSSGCPETTPNIPSAGVRYRRMLAYVGLLAAAFATSRSASSRERSRMKVR
jgi:hypothetical protein